MTRQNDRPKKDGKDGPGKTNFSLNDVQYLRPPAKEETERAKDKAAGSDDGKAKDQRGTTGRR